jgi:hypothetical protein
VKGHVHIGAVEVLSFAMMLIIVGFFMRTVETRYSETPLGKALAFIY